jgi:hypothetical protein
MPIDEHVENADSQKNESWRTDANMTIHRDSHSEKQCLPRLARGDGMQIGERDAQQENADSSITESFETDSHGTFDRDSHLHKELGGGVDAIRFV